MNPGSCTSVSEYLSHLQEILPLSVAFEVVSENDSLLRKLDPGRTTFLPDGVVTTTRIAPHTYRDFTDDGPPYYTAYLDVLTSYVHIVLPFQSNEARTSENVYVFNNQPNNQKSSF